MNIVEVVSIHKTLKSCYAQKYVKARHNFEIIIKVIISSYNTAACDISSSYYIIIAKFYNNRKGTL